MASPSSGVDQNPEPPRQVVYRRFASETRTVKVTSTAPSTAPWTATEVQPNLGKDSQILPNPKEQLDKALKWTNEQLKKCHGERQTSEGNGSTKSKLDENKISDQSSTNPANTLKQSENTSKLHKSDTPFGDTATFGGRRLSLAQRDKVVGGAAMMFADPLLSMKGFNGERRRSEYDIGRLSSMFPKLETRRLTEPEEQKMHSTLRVFRNPSFDESDLKAEVKKSPSCTEHKPSKSDKDSIQSIANTSDVRFTAEKSKSKATLLNNNSSSHSQKPCTSEPTCEKGKVPFKTKALGNSPDNPKSSSTRSENTSLREPKVEENKLQTSSKASGFHTTDKPTFKPEQKVTLQEKTSCPGSHNTKASELKCEKDKFHSQSKEANSKKASSSFSGTGCTEFHKPKAEENKMETVSNTPGFHVLSDKQTLKPAHKVTTLPENTPSSISEKPETGEKVKCEKETFHSQSKESNSKNTTSSSRFGCSTVLHKPKSEENTIQTSSNLSGLQVGSDKSTIKIKPKVSVSQHPLLLSPQNTMPVLKEPNYEKHHIQFPSAVNTNTSIVTHPENINSLFTSSDKTNNLFTDNTKITEPKTAGSKTHSNLPDKSNSSVFDQSTASCTSSKTQLKGSSSLLQNKAPNKPKVTREEAQSTLSGFHQTTTYQNDPNSGLNETVLPSQDKTNDKVNHVTETVSSATKTETDETVCQQSNSKETKPSYPENVSHENNLDISFREKTKPNQGEERSCQALPVATQTSPTEKSSDLPRSSNSLENPPVNEISRKTVSHETKCELTPKGLYIVTDTGTVPTAYPRKQSSEKDTTTTPPPVGLIARKNSPITQVKTVKCSQPKSGSQDKSLIESRANSGAGRSRSVGCPSKHELQVCSGEPLASRPVTRSKSDVGEGNKGRSAPTARKSCAERRCCGAQGAQPKPAQKAVTSARARSLSRAPPMGSTASLVPKNKVSWTTQRVLETEVQQLKRELQMHKAEELRLHREIHKLRSVLQQATSFGEDTADPDDGALLASLQNRHGMAGGTAGLSGAASKKQGVSGESCEPESGEVPRHEKDMRSRQLIKEAILDNDFLKNLPRCQIRELVDCMYPQRVQAGSYVIREGDAGSHLYVLDDGEMEVLKEGTVLGRMGPGKAFGELAILYNCTRTASIRAVSDLQVWVLDRRAFQQIMMRTGMQRLEDNTAFLRSVPLLRGISEQSLARIADALEPEFYPTDEYIVRQGARGNTFFIISGGSVEVTQRGANGYEVVLRTLSRGEYFGEQALLHDDCRTASVRALPPGVDCLTLDRESFNALIGSLSELHHKDYAEDTRSISSRTSFNHDCGKDDEGISTLHLDDLHPLGTLGVGGFGCVRLVMAPNGRSYALKCLSKRHIAVTGQQEHVTAERDVLLAARSPFIVRLFRTFRDDANVYLLLEACLGGEVWGLLRDHERLTDKEARFVSACVLEALEYLHARDIVYRDLKPENLVMDAEGYVKLVDFGFCKRLPSGCKTWTFCGTPEYVAPEVILNKGHDRAVDYWALGVLIYELLTGAPPFAATDPMATYNLILLGMESAVMPKYMSRPATHLIRRLCRAAPSERLGYQRGGFREVKAHRWFQDLDWDALRARTMTPPIKPQVSGPTDMSNFYPQTLDEELAPAELSHWDADF